jgi:putative addiction module component (TIGR02574 family)
MTKEAAELLAAAMRLSANDREELGIQILESLQPVESPAEVEAAWAEEIRKRVEDMETGRVKGIPWEEVRRMIAETKEGVNERDE